MNCITKFPLPTGYLFTADYTKGKLETLSIGDYGKHHNVKADFLGYSRPLNGVENTPCMPLSEKWVVTVSTQYGCPMKCTFCDVPNVPFRGNVSQDDLKRQLYNAISLFPGVHYTERLNLHFARMGDPIFNSAVFDFARWAYEKKGLIAIETGLRIETFHPVLTTSLPRKFNRLEERILDWCSIKNETYNGQAGLQFSINSTNENQRAEMFSGMSLTLKEFSAIAEKMPTPISRKYCLNFAFSTDYEIDAQHLVGLFNPDKFMVKITPIHNNNACRENGIKTVDGYESFAPYRRAEEDLVQVGFDVLVFVPSIDEEDGLVTCGNAILGGSELKTKGQKISIVGISA
jgi:23S rRNA (adenine2503-C2)-methyltransferase